MYRIIHWVVGGRLKGNLLMYRSRKGLNQLLLSPKLRKCKQGRNRLKNCLPIFILNSDPSGEYVAAIRIPALQR